jgi:hypothetical protein
MTETHPQALQENENQDSSWSSASNLSRKVRELAHRSHRALRAGKQPDGMARAGAGDLVEDLGDLRDQVARLQDKIHRRRLQHLIPWVDALSKQVEDRLATRER